MFIYSAKISKWRAISSILALGLFLILCILIVGRTHSSETEPALGQNTARVSYLQSLGWEVETEPIETLSITLPNPPTEEYLQYNELQKAQGMDLTPYFGQNILRYTYRVQNHPEGLDCQINLYLAGDSLIAGDLCCSGADGFLTGLAYPSATS